MAGGDTLPGASELSESEQPNISFVFYGIGEVAAEDMWQRGETMGIKN